MAENITADINGMVHPYLEEDLKLISKWVKDDIFVFYKFLHEKGGDLEAPKGKIYVVFEKQCKARLSGWKAANDEMTKQFYAKIAWETAKKQNLFASSLNLRRSGVYTVMYNRFLGKWWLYVMEMKLIFLPANIRRLSADLCKLCKENNLIFPALECFEQRLDNPNAYFLFYDNFLRAVEGEEKWKASASKSTVDGRLSSPYNEAFAMILLKNNYYAWLLDAKESYDCLITDYDCCNEESSAGVGYTLTEYLMGGICVENNDGFHTVPTPQARRQTKNGGEPTESDEESGSDEDNEEEYGVAAHNFTANSLRIRASVRNSLEYKKIVECRKRMGGDSCEKDERSRKKKKRKLMKGLKQYTGARVGQEKAYRGWSERTHDDMLEYKKCIASEATRYKRFAEEYRHVYAMRKVYGRDESDDETDSEGNKKKEIFDELIDIPEEFRL